MEKLAQYLKKHQIKKAAFARRAGLTPPTIQRLLEGTQRNLTIETIRKLILATGGEVAFSDILDNYVAAQDSER